jgi:hypothetical protein
LTITEKIDFLFYEDIMDPATFKIFISHRSDEDHELANIVCNALGLLGDKRIETFVCSSASGCIEWRDWIHEKIGNSDIMLFLYTAKSFDWQWCFYEIGLFMQPNDPHPKPIICLHNQSISSSDLPSPLEKYKAYSATKDNLEKFLTDLLYDGEYTKGEQINKRLFSGDKFKNEIEKLYKAFKRSEIEVDYYTKRALFDIQSFDPGERDEIHYEINYDIIKIKSDPSTMKEILLSAENFTKWHTLYEKFKIEGQLDWLDEIKETLDAIRNKKIPTYVMTPFKTHENRKFIPVLTRVEKIPSEDGKTNIPLKLYVIFIPCSDLERKCDFVDSVRATDPKFLLEMWKTVLPTSVIRVKWKKKSTPIRYLIEDMVDSPIVYGINPSFADLYNFNYQEFPDPDGNTPLTSEDLLKLVEEFIIGGNTYVKKIVDDQSRISQDIIFKGSNAYAKVPLKFNDRHPYYPNSSFLPCLVSKNTTGNTNGPHITYLSVIYVRCDWVVEELLE